MASTIIKRAYLFNFILSLFSTYLHLVEVYLYCSVYYIKPIHLYTKHVEIDLPYDPAIHLLSISLKRPTQRTVKPWEGGGAEG